MQTPSAASPFKDIQKKSSSKSKAQSENDHRHINLEKALPPTPIQPLSEIPQEKKRNHIKLDGKIAYLQSPEEGDDIVQNTSYESIDTDQIFMTYNENESSVANDNFDHDILQNQILIDSEIDKIKRNLQLPTVETDEDDLREESKSQYHENVSPHSKELRNELKDHNKNSKRENKSNQYSNFETSETCAKAIEPLAELRPKSYNNPLARKIVVLGYDKSADLAEAKHLNTCAGFILAPNLKFSKTGQEEYEVVGEIKHKDYEMILTKLVNSSILKSFSCTPIKVLS